MNELDNKIRVTFPGECVYKKRENYNVFAGTNIPSFIKDYLIQRYTDVDGEIDRLSLSEFLEEHVPKKNSNIKNKLIAEGKKITLLTKISVVPDIRANVLRFEIPELGIKKSDTLIPSWLLSEHQHELTTDELWGIFEIGLMESETGGNRIELCGFKKFNPYDIDLEYYRSRREDYSLPDWIDLIIRSMEYNPDGFDSISQKLLFLSRLLVFVEPNLNLIELSPKGTGKSYIFSNLTKYGWNISGGSVTRAKLFYDVGRQNPGMIMRYDFLAMDEIQTIKFGNEAEVAAGLKTYLEAGKFTVANYSGASQASFILLGNIKLDEYKIPIYKRYFFNLPKVFTESALLDRFHGFLEGWKLPRVHEDMIVQGYTLNVEYFSEVLHALRKSNDFMPIVDQILYIPPRADTRDTKAIKRICSGYLKLLFPHINSTEDISKEDFDNFCLKPAIRMRRIIREQINLIDKEYSPELPIIKVKE